MAKFMAASRRSPCTPAWTTPCGLQAAAVGTNEPSTQPRSSPSTPYSSKEAPTAPMSSMPPSPNQRSMSLIRPVTSPTVVPGCLTGGPPRGRRPPAPAMAPGPLDAAARPSTIYSDSFLDRSVKFLVE